MSDATTSDPIGRGRPYPPGANPRPDGVNSSVYSEDPNRIEQVEWNK